MKNNFPLLKTSPPWLVGILNITPNSFSDGGSYLSAQKAIEHGEYLLNCGAHILDIGGESTGPGSMPISAQEEINRIENVVKHFATKCLVSVDTYKAEVAKKVLSLGAQIINDVSAMRADSQMPEVIKEYKAYIIMMYSKEEANHPHATLEQKSYNSVIDEILQFFDKRIEVALRSGIKKEQIILDPGMGIFISQNPDYSWELLANLDKLTSNYSEFPFMIGTSRKSFLGGEIKLRDPLSQLTALSAFKKGASFFRTHNVEMAKQFFTCWEKIN